jgi:hypothetical protein
MTQFTSFVAVEEMVVTDGGQPRRIDVPVEVPEGVNREAVDPRQAGGPTGLFTVYSNAALNSSNFSYSTMPRAVTKSGTNAGMLSRRARSGGGGGRGTGSGGGVGPGTGVAAGKLPSATAPQPMVADALDAEEPAKLLSPAEKKRARLQARLHPSVLSVVDRLEHKGVAAGADEAKFIRNGQAELQVWLTDKSAEAMAELKALGFETVLDPKTAKLVIGRLPIGKIEALAELKFVRYVSPQPFAK